MSGFLFVVAAVLLFGSRLLHSIICLLLGRLVVGLASGLVTSTIPMYLAECAPIALRGTFGVLTAIGKFNTEHISFITLHWHTNKQSIQSTEKIVHSRICNK